MHRSGLGFSVNQVCSEVCFYSAGLLYPFVNANTVSLYGVIIFLTIQIFYDFEEIIAHIDIEIVTHLNISLHNHCYHGQKSQKFSAKNVILKQYISLLIFSRANQQDLATSFKLDSFKFLGIELINHMPSGANQAINSIL